MAQNLDMPHHRLTKTSKAPHIMGIKLFNMLPKHLKSINSTHLFAKRLKTYLLERPYYTINEFYDEHSNNRA